MILVIGDVTLRPDAVAEALAISREHVERSRTEHGCVSHDVHRDTEDPNRIVFVERWIDHDALMAHFAIPASNEFARALTALSSQRPKVDIYEAEKA